MFGVWFFFLFFFGSLKASSCFFSNQERSKKENLSCCCQCAEGSAQIYSTSSAVCSPKCFSFRKFFSLRNFVSKSTENRDQLIACDTYYHFYLLRRAYFSCVIWAIENSTTTFISLAFQKIKKNNKQIIFSIFHIYFFLHCRQSSALIIYKTVNTV